MSKLTKSLVTRWSRAWYMFDNVAKITSNAAEWGRVKNRCCVVWSGRKVLRFRSSRRTTFTFDEDRPIPLPDYISPYTRIYMGTEPLHHNTIHTSMGTEPLEAFRRFVDSLRCTKSTSETKVKKFPLMRHSSFYEQAFEGVSSTNQYEAYENPKESK